MFMAFGWLHKLCLAWDEMSLCENVHGHLFLFYHGVNPYKKRVNRESFSASSMVSHTIIVLNLVSLKP